MASRPRLEVRSFAQIEHADVEFGDLTVLVGPQASGKSLVLQLLKLALDGRAIAHTLRSNDLLFAGASEFLDRYFGEGTSGMWTEATSVVWNGTAVSPSQIARSRQTRISPEHQLYFIPAHRTLALASGYPLAFQQLTNDSPFVVRQFSAAVRDVLIQHAGAGALFPPSKRLKQPIRAKIDDAIFHGAELREDTAGPQRRLTLAIEGQRLPYMSWTAGQREFIPLLLGAYYLLTAGQKTKRSETWVVIEEPEMGLHPRGISAVMLLVLDLLARGYKVVLSTHAPLVLDVVWALERLQRAKAPWQDVMRLFAIDGISKAYGSGVAQMAESVLTRDYRVYMLDFDGHRRVTSHDITSLDPSSPDAAIAGWGDLTGLSGRIADVVADAMNARAPG